MRYVYISPEEYDAAARIGVTRKALYQRVMVYGWDKERAVTTPPDPRNVCTKAYSKWLKVAKNNGISSSAFAARVNRLKWEPERAATTPLLTHEESLKRAHAKVSKYAEAKKIAVQNGINPSTFLTRMHQGWDINEAMTRPANKRNRRSVVK